MIHGLSAVLAIIFSVLALGKTAEVVIDAGWTLRSGRRLLSAIEAEAQGHDKVDVAELERDFGRPQPVYGWIRRVSVKSPRVAQFLRRIYWAPTLVTLGFLVAELPAPTWALAAVLIGQTSITFVILLNAPLRRFALGPYDRFNRDLLFSGMSRGAKLLSLTAASRALSAYFLWLAYVSWIGFAGAYIAAFKVLGENSFAISNSAPKILTFVYFSAVTITTLGYGDVIPKQGWSVFLTFLQVASGPLLLAFLAAAFFSIDIPRQSQGGQSGRSPSSQAGETDSPMEESRRLVAALLVEGQRFLLGKRSASRSFRPDCWDLVGGHIEPGEASPDALHRELFEELVVDASISAFPAARWIGEGLDLSIWIVRDWIGEVKNGVPGEHDEIRWFSITDLTDLNMGDPRYELLIRSAIGSI